MRCGTHAPYGPTGPDGRTGSTTKAATKKTRASERSWSVTVSRTKRCSVSRETSSTVTATATPTATAGSVWLSAPRPRVARTAVSVVMPRSWSPVTT